MRPSTLRVLLAAGFLAVVSGATFSRGVIAQQDPYPLQYQTGGALPTLDLAPAWRLGLAENYAVHAES